MNRPTPNPDEILNIINSYLNDPRTQSLLKDISIEIANNLSSSVPTEEQNINENTNTNQTTVITEIIYRDKPHRPGWTYK